MKILASGNGRFAKRNFPFRETFAVSFAGHVYTDLMVQRIMLTTRHGRGPLLEAFSFVATIAELSRIFREILRGISSTRIS